MNYGYIRVSAIDQKIDRQLDEMLQLGLSETAIFTDKQTGTNFNRKSYRNLLKRLTKGDLLIIKSIDRLGRDYNMIMEEWRKITKDIGCDIFVIDMPLLDTRSNETNLIGRFISDIVLQILSFVAQSEKEQINKRQMEGILSAKKKGVKFGRPRISVSDLEDLLIMYLKRELNIDEILMFSNVSKSTFYRRLNEYRKNLR